MVIFNTAIYLNLGSDNEIFGLARLFKLPKRKDDAAPKLDFVRFYAFVVICEIIVMSVNKLGIAEENWMRRFGLFWSHS